ncbi:hypothetical protein T440DRAFT_273723 [Plenodomus tracheiphilus IPT5]|uniref:Uncharacterized protein n=1 Tax=Plenodomus tracheiphilus IPT5 TaxID=1408161 RepID=A0A6A7BJS4_9PLEO|nr:hypothetical protein T440DRAFT_273723 [Plenodomus tracheiphilus IPT5]
MLQHYLSQKHSTNNAKIKQPFNGIFSIPSPTLYIQVLNLYLLPIYSILLSPFPPLSSPHLIDYTPTQLFQYKHSTPIPNHHRCHTIKRLKLHTLPTTP